MSSGACRRADVDRSIFYPGLNGAVLPAKRVCSRCPVRAACLDYAITNGEDEGIWGGTTPRERARLIARSA